MIEVNKARISKELVDAWVAQWEVLNEAIFAAHERRDGSAKLLMEQGIELFEKFMVTSSISSSEEMQASEQYEVMPINGMERFQFIKVKPGQYACYRQLDELVKETKKRCARLRLKR